MKEFECKKCGSKDLFIEESSNNTGLYCADCGKWITWLNKDDLRLAKRFIDSVTSTTPVSEELTFLGLNVTQHVLNQMMKTKPSVASIMNPDELKAYELGISNTLAYLQVFLSDSEHIIVNTFTKPSEYSYEDLKEYINRVLYNTIN